MGTLEAAVNKMRPGCLFYGFGGLRECVFFYENFFNLLTIIITLFTKVYSTLLTLLTTQSDVFTQNRKKEKERLLTMHVVKN